jgi:hypothetical protein
VARRGEICPLAGEGLSEGVAGTVGGFVIEDAGGALASGGGAVLAAFVGESWFSGCGLHGCSFLDFLFISKI